MAEQGIFYVFAFVSDLRGECTSPSRSTTSLSSTRGFAAAGSR